jgi:hypothetical protein
MVATLLGDTCGPCALLKYRTHQSRWPMDSRRSSSHQLRFRASR